MEQPQPDPAVAPQTASWQQSEPDAQPPKVVILAGGFGTRLAEETEMRPKPMVEIGGRPILWHIMKHFGHFGLNRFVIALGYKGEIIKRFFMDYHALRGNLTVDLGSGNVEVERSRAEAWRVELVETGLSTLTGGRVRRLRPYVSNDTFIVTYGDGVSDIDVGELLAFHRSHGCVATVTAVRPPARYGALDFNGNFIARFREKPQSGEGWINGGYLVFEPRVFDYLESDESSLEADALERLAADGQLAAYRHDRFWQCMDTVRDLQRLRDRWERGQAPWRIWT